MIVAVKFKKILEDINNINNLALLTLESQFTHATQDFNHGHRADSLGIRVIEKLHIHRRSTNYDV